MLIETRALRALAVMRLAPPRDGNELDVPAPCQFANALGNFVAVEDRHADIEQRDIRP